MEIYRLRVRTGHVGRDNVDGVRVFGGIDGVVITVDPTRAKPADIDTRLRHEALAMLQAIRQRLASKEPSNGN